MCGYESEDLLSESEPSSTSEPGALSGYDLALVPEDMMFEFGLFIAATLITAAAGWQGFLLSTIRRVSDSSHKAITDVASELNEHQTKTFELMMKMEHRLTELETRFDRLNNK